MKVLVVVRKGMEKRFLIKLESEEVLKEVAELIAKRKNAQAMACALARGRFDREVEPCDMATVKADIILTEESVHWDLMK